MSISSVYTLYGVEIQLYIQFSLNQYYSQIENFSYSISIKNCAKYCEIDSFLVYIYSWI